MSGHVVAICGGVGGAKLAHGLALALPPDELTVIVNTGDDFQHLGLHISPDLDSVMYALAGLSDPIRGWGRRDESWAFMEALGHLNGETWFQLGDKDLAVHVERTWRLSQGASLSEVTAYLCRALGIAVQIVPMSDDPIRTRVQTASEGWLDFQDYFVRRRCEPPVVDFEFAGAESARAQPQALAALARRDLRAIVICPSNPFVSVEPILAVPGMRNALREAAPVVAVTPIIGGKAIKGPAAKMLAELGLDVSGAAVARRYAGLATGFIVDQADPMPEGIEDITFFNAATLMNTVDDRLQLARAVLQAADSLSARNTSSNWRPHHG